MKKSLIKITIFILPVLVFITIFEIILGSDSIVNSNKKKKKNLEENKNTIETLFLGSSQSLFGINPELIDENTYNFANVSQSYYLENKLIEKYTPQLTNLKKVYIAINYPSFFMQLSDSPEDWREDLYTLEYGIPASKERSFIQKNSYYNIYGIKTLPKILKAGFNIDLAKDIDKNGFKRIPVSNNKITQEIAKDRIKYHHSIMNTKYIESNILALKEMTSTLTDKNIEVLFYSTPTTNLYRQFQEDFYLNKKDSILNIITQNGKFNFIDLESDNRFNNSHFVDADHLNEKGAEVLSLILKGLNKDF